MKIMIVTTPINDAPTYVAPIGAMSIINYVRKRTNHNIEFFNIDYLRPSYESAIERIVSAAPDIIGISSVVSTAYEYTKRLGTDIKRRLPNTLIVCGGNLCASAEILLRRASIDICVNGEGEIPFLNVVNRFETTRRMDDFKDIPGLMLLDASGELKNTGYEAPLPAKEVWDVDWKDLEPDGSIDHYFPLYNKPQHYKTRYATSHPNHALHAGNKKARSGQLLVAKGCVARCTFCHRWDRGIRHVPVDEIMRRFEQLYNEYDVRDFGMIAETFGTDKKWLNELLDRIEPYQILWFAQGVRTSMVTPGLIDRMKQTGCTALIYGNETGSKKMLEIMEKKVSMEDNYNAARWSVEAKMGNIIQLIVGMPGESPETIQETIEYTKFGTTISPEQNPRIISINYAQALPGTPLYEYARIHGMLGGLDLDSEEAYLLAISDRPAGDPETFLNFTRHKRLTVISWHLLIRIEVYANYVNKYGFKHYFEWLKQENPPSTWVFNRAIKKVERTGSPGLLLFMYLALTLKVGHLLAWYPTFFFRTKKLAPLYALITTTYKHGLRQGGGLIADLFKPNRFATDDVPTTSLRKIVVNEKTEMKIDDGLAMAPLRAGR
jgi:radical SAM superfamily enzyme YgiQ (UPF0313 family)